MELRQYIELILTRKWIIIQAAIITAIVAVTFTLTQPPAYKSTAKIFIKGNQGESLFPESAAQFWSDPDRNIQNQIELIKASSVASKVVKSLGLDTTASALANSIAANHLKGTDIIELSYTDIIPERARDIVNVYAKEYINSRREESIRQLSVAIGQLKAKIEDVKMEQLELAAKMSENDESLKRRLEFELAFSNQLYSILAEKYETLRVDQTLKKGGAELYEPSQMQAAPINPSPARNGILGLIAGAFLGVGIAFLMEHIDNTIKTPEDVMKHFGLPTIGQIPSNEFGKERWAPKESLIVSLHPKSSTSEAYRALRNNLKFLNPDGDTRTIMVASALPGVGKTTTVANLSAALAEIGYRVIIVCCDLRKPNLHKIFGVTNDIGTTNVLIGDLPVDDVLKDTEVSGLQIIPSGPIPPVPSDLLNSPNMSKLINECRARANFVIIDTPPVLLVTDAAILATAVDGIIVIASAGKTTFEAAKQFKNTFEKTGARLLGVVLNHIDTISRYGNYYYYYSYGYKNPYIEQPPSDNGNRKVKKRKTRTTYGR